MFWHLGYQSPCQESTWDQCRVCWALGFVEGFVCVKVGRAEAHAWEMKSRMERKVEDEVCLLSCVSLYLHPGLVLQLRAAVTSPVGSHKAMLMPDPAPGMGKSWSCALYCTVGWILEKGSSARGWLEIGTDSQGRGHSTQPDRIHICESLSFRSACGGFLCHFYRGSEVWPSNSLFPDLTFKNDLTLSLFLCTSLSKVRCVSWS